MRWRGVQIPEVYVVRANAFLVGWEGLQVRTSLLLRWETINNTRMLNLLEPVLSVLIGWQEINRSTKWMVCWVTQFHDWSISNHVVSVRCYVDLHVAISYLTFYYRSTTIVGYLVLVLCYCG